MIELNGLQDEHSKPPATERSVVVFFNDGEVVVVPEFAFDKDDKTLKEKASCFMYFPENEMHHYIWAIIIGSMGTFTKKTYSSIKNENLKDSDYEKFFKMMGIKYEILDEETVTLKAPAFSRKGVDEYIIKGKPWMLGLIVYMKDNMEELGGLAN